jgi:ribosomal protein S18 acetylase RimI-like enzyme
MSTSFDITSSEPIFAVADVVRSVRFYRDVVGFEQEWLWGDPPVHAGVRWGNVQLMFSKQPPLAERSRGNQHFFRVQNVRALYDRHKSLGAPIIHDLENKPWGLSEYVIRDLDGYELRFAGGEIYERSKTATESLPSHIKIEVRTPSSDEARMLMRSVNWGDDADTTAVSLQRTLISITASDTREQLPRTVGMTRVVGDGKHYSIWDVIVHPDYQGQKIGTAMMETSLAELRKIAKKGAFVGLFAAKPDFYEKLGFTRGCGMHISL